MQSLGGISTSYTDMKRIYDKFCECFKVFFNDKKELISSLPAHDHSLMKACPSSRSKTISLHLAFYIPVSYLMIYLFMNNEQFFIYISWCWLIFTFVNKRKNFYAYVQTLCYHNTESNLKFSFKVETLCRVAAYSLIEIFFVPVCIHCPRFPGKISSFFHVCYYSVRRLGLSYLRRWGKNDIKRQCAFKITKRFVFNPWLKNENSNF